MDKDGIQLYKAINYTNYSEPETSIGAITWRYVANTTDESMSNHNINLAYIKGLKVELLEYGSSECRVEIDSRRVVSNYQPSELKKILSYVKKATELNMREHNVRCPLKEIKSKKATTPKALNLETTTINTFSKYKSNFNKQEPFVFDRFYPLGYSYDGSKMAYIIEHDTNPADIVHIETIIQDLVTDKIVWRDNFKKDRGDIDFKSFWDKNHKRVLDKLSKYKIHFDNHLHFYRDHLGYMGDTLFLSNDSAKSPKKDWGSMLFLDSSTIYIHSKRYGEKIINQKSYNNEHILERKPIGYITLGTKSKKRVAVVVATLRRGWEGPPHNIIYEIIGANLAKGFRKK
jgi:hypothetical protein